MKNWPVALCAAVLVGLAVFIHGHSRASAPAAAAEHSKPTTDSVTVSNKTKAATPAPIPLALALLPAPGPQDANRKHGTSDPAGGAADPSVLAGHAAARDAALAKGADEFFRATSELLEHSPPPAAASLPVLSLRHSVRAGTEAALALPLHAGRASLGWVTHSIRSAHQLPPANAVRLEEILNSFTLRPTGFAAICQGVSITTESLPCPWKPSATLLLISIHGAPDTARDVTATFHADPATVALYRLLGFAPVNGLTAGALPSRLPAKSLTTLALEIEPSSAATAFGSLEWTLDGQPAAAIPITHHLDAEPSNDARFASVVCAFAQWLAHDQPAFIDAELLAALAREITSATLPPDRADLLILIDQALSLAEK